MHYKCIEKLHIQKVDNTYINSIWKRHIINQKKQNKLAVYKNIKKLEHLHCLNLVGFHGWEVLCYTPWVNCRKERSNQDPEASSTGKINGEREKKKKLNWT